jgi:diacylglycerol kinase (ATP)
MDAKVIIEDGLLNKDTRVELDAALRRLRSGNFSLSLLYAKDKEEIQYEARLASDDYYPVCIAVGGDRCLNGVLNGIIGSSTRLAIIPLRPLNLFAEKMHIPYDLLQASDIIIKGHTRKVDVVRAGLEYFLSIAGVGVRNNDFFKLPHQPVNETMNALSFKRGTRFYVQVDSSTHRKASALLISNLLSYDEEALNMKPFQKVTDGMIDVLLFWKGLWRFQYAFFRCKEITLSAKGDIPVFLDGERTQSSPKSFNVIPEGIEVILPEESDTKEIMEF